VDSWWASVDARIETTLARYGLSDDTLNEEIGQALGETTHELRVEFGEDMTRIRRELETAFDAKLAAAEERLRSTAGKLPMVKIWREGCVTYEGELASFDGSLWQARMDTGERPGGKTWVCIARAARDASSVNPRGEFDRHDAQEREGMRDEFDEAVSKLRIETGENLRALREHMNDALAGLDRGRLDRIEESIDWIRGEFEARVEKEGAGGHDEVPKALAELRREVETKFAALSERLHATAGELPQVQNWKPETVAYRGQLFASGGGLWQSRKDTATAPGGPDWTLIARSPSVLILRFLRFPLERKRRRAS
jgi:hypothetical protein